MKIKLERYHLIVLTIAFLFIFYGLAQAIFGFTLNKKLFDEISVVVIGVAFYLFFSGRRKRKLDKEQNNVAGSTEEIIENKTEDIIEVELDDKKNNKTDDE